MHSNHSVQFYIKLIFYVKNCAVGIIEADLNDSTHENELVSLFSFFCFLFSLQTQSCSHNVSLTSHFPVRCCLIHHNQLWSLCSEVGASGPNWNAGTINSKRNTISRRQRNYAHRSSHSTAWITSDYWGASNGDNGPSND